MSEKQKLAILAAISSIATPGLPARLSFHSMGKNLALSKQDMHLMLTELNRERFISQYAKKGVDSFTVVINQKGIDAVEDESSA